MADTDTWDDEKLRVTSDWMNTLARRITTHAVVHAETMETEPRPPAPAWYDPKTGDAHVHLDLAGVVWSDFVNSASKDYVRTRALMAGLVAHEISHSRWSGWLHGKVVRECESNVRQVLTIMEELRIERRVIERLADARSDLRASLPLAMGELKENVPTTRYEVARSWTLIYGRVIASIVTPKEMQWLDDAVRTVIGDDDRDALADIIQEVMETEEDEDGVRRLIGLAEEWIAIAGEPTESDWDGCGGETTGSPGTATTADEDVKGEGEAMEGEPDDGEATAGEPEEDDDEPPGDDGGDLSPGLPGTVEHRHDLREDDGEGDDEMSDSEISEEDAEMIKKMLEDVIDAVEESWDDPGRLDMADPRQMASAVFGKDDVRAEKRITRTEPTAQHLHHVAETAKVLELLTVPAITKVAVPSLAPPGRLDTREAVRASAERAQGRMVTARPWQTTRRRHASVRPIVVGVATDTSGSMKWAERVVADFAYTWTNAAQRVSARTAAVTFGDHVTRIAKPGEILSKIPTKPANEGTEEMDKAVAALDGVLHFSAMDHAAKLLVVVSDAVLVITEEDQRILQRFTDFVKAGTKIIWVTPNSRQRLLVNLKKKGLAEVIEVPIGSSYADSGERLFDQVQQRVLQRIRSMV